MRIVIGETEYTVKIGKNGYRYIYLPNRGWYLHHRMVVEQSLQRKLCREEHVHHANGDPLDNRLENLVVMAIDEHGHEHSTQRWRNHVIPKRNCQSCGKLFAYAGYREKTATYCSYKCMGAGYQGKHYRTHQPKCAV